jgi:hypothetical protein
MTNTDRLIEQLAANLEPVEPLRSPGRRAAAFMLGATLYVALLTLAIARPGAASRGVDPAVLVPQLVALAASLLAVRAAFASVVPGHDRSTLVWAAIGVVAWVGALAVSAFGFGAPAEHGAVLGARHEIWCVALILAGGAPLVAGLAAMLRRGAPLSPITTATLGAVAVGSLANAAACFWTPHADGISAFFWHGGAILALVLACAAGAPFVLSWRGARRCAAGLARTSHDPV